MTFHGDSLLGSTARLAAVLLARDPAFFASLSILLTSSIGTDTQELLSSRPAPQARDHHVTRPRHPATAAPFFSATFPVLFFVVVVVFRQGLRF